MAKKKLYRGHYCKVCGQVLPNEQFTGRGHAAHICKKCAKKPVEQRDEEIALNRISRVYMYMNLSRENRRMLENYSRGLREKIRLTALNALAVFTKCTFPGDAESERGG